MVKKDVVCSVCFERKDAATLNWPSTGPYSARRTELGPGTAPIFVAVSVSFIGVPTTPGICSYVCIPSAQLSFISCIFSRHIRCFLRRFGDTTSLSNTVNSASCGAICLSRSFSAFHLPTFRSRSSKLVSNHISNTVMSSQAAADQPVTRPASYMVIFAAYQSRAATFTQ